MHTVEMIKTHQRLGKEARAAGHKEVADLHDATCAKIVEMHNDAAQLTRDLNTAHRIFDVARKPLTMLAAVYTALPEEVKPDDGVPILIKASLLETCFKVIEVIGAEVVATPEGAVLS